MLAKWKKKLIWQKLIKIPVQNVAINIVFGMEGIDGDWDCVVQS